MMKRLAALLLLVPALTACDDSTAPAGTAPLDLRFATVAGAADLGTDASARLVPGEPAALTIPTEGGAYVIEDVQLIVSEFELEGTDTCIEEEDDGEIEYEECEFESGPHLVDLPLDGGMLSLGTGFIAEGTYTSVEFEVEDAELDDDDDGEKETALADLLAELRVAYPAFPAGASMVVSGHFAPTSGDPEPFTVYFAAEIEIEMPLVPALVVPDNAALTISVDPATWFTGLDLLAHDGQVVEFELEMEHGFVEAEGDDDDHDDD